MRDILSIGLKLAARAMIAMTLAVSMAWSDEIPSNQDPINLGNVDPYRRDNTLVDMDTCLAIADNMKALDLWASGPFKDARTQPDHGLADYLDEMDLFWRHELGFGTIYACAEVIGAWYARPQTYAFGGDDGRLLHGTIVIDLATDQEKSDNKSGKTARYGLIDALALVRILNAPFLLPQSSFGGIVIRHARIEGSLLFHNLQLRIPLAFVDVEFRGNDYSKVVLGQNKPIEDAALTIAFSDFSGSLLIARSSVCGNIRVIDSRFGESVTLDEVEQKSLFCRPLSEFEELEVTPPILRIDSSFFDQSLELTRSAFGQASIFGSNINKLSSDKGDFGRSAEIAENDIGLLQIRCSLLAGRMQILRNRIDKQLLVEGIDTVRNRKGKVLDTACHDWWQESDWLRPETRTRLTVDDNLIGGRLYLDRFRGSDFGLSLRLTNNRVSGGSRVVMPSPDSEGHLWPGGVSFNGSTYDGNLEIRHAAGEVDSQATSPAQTSYCGATPDIGDSNWTTIFLNVAHVRTLIWNLPLTCGYRWHGHGLTYDLWMSGDFAKASLAAAVVDNKVNLDHAALMNWRTGLKRHDPSPLTTLSHYLAGKGQYVESRRVLYEAKRLNYAPDCKPDDPVWMCLWQMVAGAPNTGALAAEPDGQTERQASTVVAETGTWTAFTAWFKEAAAWVTRFGMLVLLWPGGYGASPEWAIVLLFLLFGVCWFVYHRYTRTMRRRLIEEWSYIDRFLDEHKALISRSKTVTADQRGLEEAQVAFDFGKGSAAEADALWISRQTWVEEMTDQDRLSEIQGPLLDKIKAWEAGSSGPALKTFQDFRKHLARFGNTEIAGFDRFDGNKMPKRFTERLYAFDTMLPVVDLHAYSNYYPIAGWARMLSVLQHVCGWWWVTVFIASAAIL